MEKVTYASLGSLGEEFHSNFDRALSDLQKKLGLSYPLFIGGKVKKAREGVFRKHSPSDTRVLLGQFQLSDRGEARQAIAAAKTAFLGWRDTPWPARIKLLRKAADLIADRQYELAAIMT